MAAAAAALAAAAAIPGAQKTPSVARRNGSATLARPPTCRS